MKLISGGVCAAQGFKASGIHCGIRRNHSKKDLALIVSEVPASAAAVYTTNLVKGAPLTVTKNNIADGIAQAVICNSGNANTCNWNGIEIAEGMCALVEQHTGISAKNVVVASTGVIGQVLDLIWVWPWVLWASWPIWATASPREAPFPPMPWAPASSAPSWSSLPVSPLMRPWL